MLSRKGTSLVELLVALTLASVVLSAATGSLLRQQRTTSSLMSAGQAATQLRAATGLLPAQLALHAPFTGDLVAGEMRDTALQLRAAIASGIACDSADVITLAMDPDSLAAGGVASPPGAGDSLWWYRPDSSCWTGIAVLDAWSDSATCAASSTPANAAQRHRVLRLRVAASETVPALAPVRITRQLRIALYKSGDGSWQLGLREWSDVTHSFAGPQPVAGPFQRVGDDGRRTGFRYFDAMGMELWPELDPAARARTVRVRFTALVPSAVATGAGAPAARDSADVVLQPDGGP